MAQRLIQTQEQRLVQQQRLSAQQMLQVRLLEMPLAELEQNVRAEMDDNPALDNDGPMADGAATDTALESPINDEGGEVSTDDREGRSETLDALTNDDDDMPRAQAYYADEAERETMAYGDQTSFYDVLREQMGETSLTERQQDIMEYLIGSLDTDGLLRKDLSTVSDELAVYHNIDASEEEIGQVLRILQGFDPAGIGAQSLQQCLLIQIGRRQPSLMKERMERVVGQLFDDFTHNNWQAIGQSMGLDHDDTLRLQREILRLNPKPGAAMGETEGRSTTQITPDFIVETADDGTVTFHLNSGRVPRLSVSATFTDIVNSLQGKSGRMNRSERDAYVYARDKVERARNYIAALQQRRQTLCLTMQTIIDIQRPFFAEGDENDLRPMVLKDIASRTGLDISTVSRVCNSKYCQTRWGVYRLRFFFSEALRTSDGQELSVHRIKNSLREAIDGEDKRHPLSDDALAQLLKEQGLPVARRTVTKYREQMGLPSARMRKA